MRGYSHAEPRTLFTSPWRGEVGERSELGGGECCIASPLLRIAVSPHPDALRASTLPLQGRMGARSEFTP